MGYFSFGKDGQQLFDAYPYGGLGEYMTAPQENCIKLPDTVSFEQGARFGYLGTAYSALKKAQVGPGKTVLIDGASGTLGIGGVLNALAMGATKIFGTGRNAELLQDVKALAPDRIEVHAVGDGSLKDFVLEHNGGEGRRRRHLHPRPRVPEGDPPRGPLHPRPRRQSSSTSAA